MLLFKQLLADLLSLLFPNLCCGCGAYLFQGEEQLCTICLYRLPYTDHYLHADNIAARQFWGRLPCNAVMALLYFKKGGRTQQIIHNLKYRGRKDLGLTLGKMIGEKLRMNNVYSDIDLIVPVPLHRSRQLTRGYNQSMYIAKGIADELNIPISTSNLIRNKRTGTQTKKGRYSRFENMLTVFAIENKSAFSGKHVLLVDDVMTTGATLEACGTILVKTEISKLSIATIAFAK